MSLQVLMVIHSLPLWFLIFVLWLGGPIAPFHLHGIVPLVFAILLPRVLVLYLIYMDQGISLWFIIHLVAALMVWGGSGSYSARRRRYRDA
jgi:hypothetical protein